MGPRNDGNRENFPILTGASACVSLASNLQNQILSRSVQMKHHYYPGQDEYRWARNPTHRLHRREHVWAPNSGQEELPPSIGLSWEDAGDEMSEDHNEVNFGPSRMHSYEPRQQWGWRGGAPRAGSHFGKGPKNYIRSDARVQEDVNEALYRHDDIDASNIEVSVDNGEVILRGTVETRQEKRLAEDCIEGVSGVKDISNHLRIGRTQ